MNNLHRRLDKIEERRNMKRFQLPSMFIRFIDVAHDEDGRPYPGPCVKMLKIQPGDGQQWYDAGGNLLPSRA